MNAPDPHLAARQLVERITADLKILRADGLEIAGVGVGANDRVQVELRALDEAWIELIRSRYGDQMDFRLGDYSKLM